MTAGVEETSTRLASGGLRRRVLRDSASLATGQVSALAVATLLGLLGARWLGAAGKGQLVLAFAVASLLGPLGAGGIDSYIAARSAADSPAWQRSIAALGRQAARRGGLVLGLSTVGYGLAVGLPLGLVVVAALAALLRPAMAVLQAIATSQDRVASIGRVLMATAGIQLGVVALLALDGPTIYDFALSSLVSLGLGCLMLRRRSAAVLAGPAETLEPARRRAAWRFGRTVVLGDALQLANYRLDVFFLAAFVPVADVGVYAVAVTLVEVLWQLPHAISRSVLPRVVSGQIDRAKVNRLARLLAAVLTALALAGLVGTALLTVPLLGTDYRRVPALVAMMLPGVLLVGATKPLAAWTLAQGHPRINLQASAMGFAVVVVANLALVPHYGISGAAIASTLSYAVTAFAIAARAPVSSEPPRSPSS